MEPLLTLIKTVSAENVGIVLDSWHWHVGGGGADQLAELKPEQIVSVRLADIPDDVNLATIDDSLRVAPGEGGLVDCAAIVRALSGIGYEGPVSLFPYPSRFRTRTRDKTVQRATAALDSIWEAAGLSRFGRAEESAELEDAGTDSAAGEEGATPAGDAATEEKATAASSE